MLTGSSGFLGQKVARKLMASGYSIIPTVRTTVEGRDAIAVGAMGPTTDWRPALDGCEAVIHLAAAIPGRKPVDQYTKVNDEGTQRLAEQAIDSGVKCLIAVSSVAVVCGNHTEDIVDDKSLAQPVTEYGRSKLAAETHIAAFGSSNRVGISVRPPLVYGAKAKGNWHLLQRLAASNLPLPFGSINNRRSLISVDNLADALVIALERASPEKCGAYTVADNGSISLAQIVAWLREGMGKPARLIPVPNLLLAMPLQLVGRGSVAESLFGNFEIDASRFRDVFGWSPPQTSKVDIIRSGKEFTMLAQSASMRTGS